ncbi:hypothetical protein [Clavibacter tessellarius]|uniref:hypothetical protein n=1 Tax=Clavibacter tessellarius TaxID=31965 RepID=UPI0032532DE2
MSPTLLALDAVHQASAHLHHAMDAVAIDVPNGDAQAPADWTEKFGRIIGIAKWVLLPSRCSRSSPPARCSSATTGTRAARSRSASSRSASASSSGSAPRRS